MLRHLADSLLETVHSLHAANRLVAFSFAVLSLQVSARPKRGACMVRLAAWAHLVVWWFACRGEWMGVFFLGLRYGFACMVGTASVDARRDKSP